MEVEVGEYRAVVEDGKIHQTLPIPQGTGEQIRLYIKFLQEVLEAKEKTR